MLADCTCDGLLKELKDMKSTINSAGQILNTIRTSRTCDESIDCSIVGAISNDSNGTALQKECHALNINPVLQIVQVSF